MLYLILALIAVVVVAVAGALVYRKNSATIDAEAAKAKAALDKINQ